MVVILTHPQRWWRPCCHVFDLPSKASFFFCGDTFHSVASSEDSLQLQLKAEGARLSSSKIEKLAKQTHHLSVKFHQARDHMENFYSLFVFVFGTNEAITSGIKTQINHMTINNRIYIQLQLQDNTILSNVGFTVNVAVQLFLRSCCQAVADDNMAFSALDLSSMQHIILGLPLRSCWWTSSNRTAVQYDCRNQCCKIPHVTLQHFA